MPLHAEPSLTPVLAQQLRLEMPAIEFTFLDRPWVDAIWVCGYERGRTRIVRRLRLAHPEATLVVSGRGPAEAWGPEVLHAGADHACAWPVDYTELAGLLHPSRLAPAPLRAPAEP